MGAKLFSTRAAAGGPTFQTATADSGVGSAGLRPRSRFFGRLLETAALLLFTAAAFLLLALATARVDPLDPAVHGANWVGPAGGNIAALLIQGFGLAAWLLPSKSRCAARRCFVVNARTRSACGSLGT